VSAAFQHRNDKLFCDDISAEELVATYGTPLYVYSETAIVERYRAVDKALNRIDRLIAYSVKANGNLAVLKLLAENGAGADIVSAGELLRARLAGIPTDRIVFSGVGKTVNELAAGMDAGIYSFNVESVGELTALNDLGEATGRRAPFALRVNPDIESPTPHAYTRTGHRATKFGLPIEDAPDLYKFARDSRGLEVKGVDVHIGSQILEVEPYRMAMQRVLDLVESLRRAGIDLEYIDLGGGFGVSYEGGPGPTALDFAQALVPDLKQAGLRLVLEPGRFIMAPSGILLTRVIYVKHMGGKTFAITDAGMNDLLRPSHYSSYHHVDSAQIHPERAQVRVDVVGPICETGDFLALDRQMQDPQPGELLALRTVGAYGFSMASTYNARTRPAEVFVHGAKHRLIRKRETLDDLVRGEVELLG
jgi:diaminopimelate decarboxylase